jgi:hypothetical protein
MFEAQLMWFQGIPQGIPQGIAFSQDYEVFPKKVLGEGCSGLVVMAKGRTDGRHLGPRDFCETITHTVSYPQCIAKNSILLYSYI